MTRQEILRRFIPEKGILLTLLLAISCSVFYFAPLYKAPAHTYFSPRGDGFQIYYETVYHIKYDQKWWHQESTNYPYGESIFFTGAMPFVTNLAKIFDSSGSFGVWLINILMLLSPVIGALFLYLIFRHLKLPWIYASVTAVGIAFLSPQILRMSGHYSLQWVFLLPAFIYLLLRFYDFPSLKKSWAIAFLVFLGATTHMYFLAFFFALGGIYWFVLFVTRDRGFGRLLFVAKHAAIQLLLPFALITLITTFTDPVHDRTNFPWGYFIYHATSDGLFYPFGMAYESVADKIVKHHTFPEWEGLSYVGLAAILGLVIGLGVFLYRLVKRRFKLLLSVTDNKPLNIFFWMSILLAWIACGHPFIGGNEDWILYLGPVKQFRAIGRFAWVFFYMANIVAVYRVYRIFESKRIVQYVFCALIAGVLFLDGYYYLRPMKLQFNNQIAELDDKQHTMAENQWLHGFDASNYQAILPLPFYVIGSENLGKIPPNTEVIFRSYIASLQTGLPILSTSAARTSLSQSNDLLALVLDPTRPYPVLKAMPDKRPLLLLVTPNDSLNPNEKRLLSLAKPLSETPKFNLYSLDPTLLYDVYVREYESVKTDFETRAKFTQSPFLLSDSSAFLVYKPYNTNGGIAYKGASGNVWKVRDFNAIYDSILPAGDYVANFWINRMNQDVYPRTVVEVAVTDSTGKCTYYDAVGVQWRIKALDGSWGLVEVTAHSNNANDHLKITIWHTEMKRSVLNDYDEFLLRPANVDVFRKEGDTYFRNNRYYSPAR